jgi:hypothetical protein
VSQKPPPSALSPPRPMLGKESEPDGDALAPLARAIVELAIQIRREDKTEQEERRQAA